MPCMINCHARKKWLRMLPAVLPAVWCVGLSATLAVASPDAAGRADVTEKLQREIDAAWRAGGGTVRVAAGDWSVRSVRLRSGVTLWLEKGAHLWASRLPRDYDGLLERDAVERVTRFAGEDLLRPWENAIVRIHAATNVSIVGEADSFIDGQNCADASGEEGYRGPHGVGAAFSTNVTLRGVTLRNTGNWATRFVHCADLTFDGVTVLGGHDGVHVRASDRIRIANCTLNTGDDSIAGFANRDVLVTNCFLRSACSPFRFGGRDVLVVDSRAVGPADYPHRWTLTKEERLGGAGPDEVKGRRTTGCMFQPFTDNRYRREMRPGNIVFRNVLFENANRFMVFLNGLGALWQDGTAVEDIVFEGCVIRGMARPSVVYAPEKVPLRLVFRSCSFACATRQPTAFLHKNVEFVCENVRTENVGAFAERKEDLSYADVPEFPSWRIESDEQRAKWGLPPLHLQPAEETCACPISRNVKGHENVEWSIAYAYGVVRETHLPRVLLIGDSILVQHEDLVRKELGGKMTVSYWGSSYCLTHPNYLKLLDFYLQENEYAVIHFNNGLHSLRTPTEAWTKALREALALIRRRCPKAKIVWRTSTPMNDPVKAPRVKELNAAAAKVVAETGDIAVDDLFASMEPLDRAANWSDTCHFKDGARKIQAKQVSASCLKAAGIK